MTKFELLLSCAIGAVLLPVSAANAASAADTDGTSESENTFDDVIIVTAQKREERLQSVPIAISAYDAKTLQRANVDSVADLQNLAPSLQFASIDGASLISIRGIGTTVLAAGADPGIALHLDGVYLARAQYHDAALFDVERVEVLRGPQGTVSGRNATGGAINIITREPTDEKSGYVNVGVGNYSASTTSGAVGGPLTGDDVMWRLAWKTNNHKGYTPNTLTGNALDAANQQSVRGQLLFNLSERAELLLSVDLDTMDTSGFANMVLGTLTGLPLPGEAFGGNVATGRTVNSNGPSNYRRTVFGGSARLTVELDGAVLTSKTGYRQFSERSNADIDGTDFDFVHERHQRDQWQVSQELNLTSDNDSAFSWLAGVYYLHEDLESDERYNFIPLGFTFILGGNPVVDSYAAYAQGSYQFSDKFEATFGLRYTQDEKSTSEYNRVPEFAVDVTENLSGSWGAVTPKLSLSYKVTEDSLAYASISRGFRSGGFNVGGLQGSPFDPEYVWSYEAGLKQQFFDKRLTANLAFFRSEYTDMQVFQIRALTATVENAASSTLQGAELELVALLGDGLRLDFSGSYIDTKFNEFSTRDESRPGLGEIDLTGNQLARAPKARANVGVEKRWVTGNDGAFTVRGNYSWTDRVYFSEFNRPEMSQAAVGLWNAKVSYESPGGRYSVSAYVENITDELIFVNKLAGAGSLGFGILAWPAAPRTFGVQFGVNF